MPAGTTLELLVSVLLLDFYVSALAIEGSQVTHGSHLVIRSDSSLHPAYLQQLCLHFTVRIVPFLSLNWRYMLRRVIQFDISIELDVTRTRDGGFTMAYVLFSAC